MFSFNRKCNFEEKIEKIEKKIKDLEETIEKVDIKAMEAQRSYRAKLKRITGDEEKKENETNKNPNVFLSPNGSPI